MAGYAAVHFDTVSLRHERDRRTAARQHRPHLCTASLSVVICHMAGFHYFSFCLNHLQYFISCTVSRHKNFHGTSFSFDKVTGRPHYHVSIGLLLEQEDQLSLTNRAMLVCKVVEVWQNFLSEYVDKKFTYICYRRLIRHE